MQSAGHLIQIHYHTIEILTVVCYYIIFQLIQCKMLVCMLSFMRFHVQMTIYWCIRKNEGGLINSRFCCFIHWDILYLP